MNKLVVVAKFLFAGLIIVIFIVALVPHAAPKVGPPFVASMGSNLPLIVYVPMNNRGHGTLEVTTGIWGSPTDISHGTVNGLQPLKVGPETSGSGSILVQSSTTFFLPSYRDYNSPLNNCLLGEIMHKRKYPVHLGFGWRRGNLEGAESFLIPPDKDVVVPVPTQKHN